MKILVLNCGSSSVKYKLLDMEQKKELASGGAEKIGMKGSILKHKKANGEKVEFEGEMLEQSVALEYILGVLTSEKHGAIKNLNEISAVGHRVVHGGEKYNRSVLVTDEVIKYIEECFEIAPLHNPPNLAGINAIKAILPEIPQVVVFDTAFHQTMPDYAYMYGIPYALYKKYGIRRYGFHGTSHRYVSKRACEFLGLDYEKTKIVTAHIGNGASITAIENGKSVDTSMGFTPLEGLMMGTRSGDMDLSVVTYLMEKELIGTKATNTLFNKHSGVLGVSGISSDMRDIENAVKEGNARAKLALDMYEYRIKKYIGAYAAALNGFDVLVFTGGVGENQSSTREKLVKQLTYLGVDIDVEKNKVRGEEIVISTENSKVKVVVIPTDEELMIAMDTMDIVNGKY